MIDNFKYPCCEFCRYNTWIGRETFNSNRGYRNDDQIVQTLNLQEQNTSPSSFKLSYPFISNTTDKIYKKINDAILDEVNSLFRSQVLVPEEIDFNEIQSFYEVKLNEKGLLSILFGLYTYVNRAAHGFTAYSSLTIDTTTGKKYSFQDLFNPKIYYKPFLDNLAKKYIEDNNIQLIEEYNGITPNQQFYLTPDTLVLYYQVYEYTPYVQGIFEIKIPYKDIVNLLGPLSPIQRLL